MGRWKIIKYISFDFSKPTSKTNDLKELFPNRIAAGASIQVPSIPKDQTSNGFLHREAIICILRVPYILSSTHQLHKSNKITLYHLLHLYFNMTKSY